MWIKTTADFRHGISDAVWEMYSEEQRRECLESVEYRFNTDDICSYNRATHGVTIRFKNYEDSITINMSIEELDALFFPKETKSGAGELLQTNYNNHITLQPLKHEN